MLLPPPAPDLPPREPLADTRMVIAALPDAQIAREWTIEAGLPTTVFDVTFLPPGTDAPRRRLHAVAFGKTRLIHVIETAPIELELPAGTITEIARSIREEG